MNIFKYKLEPNEVFNPRGEYNPQMYINRPIYEETFGFAIESDMCVVVHGQSGTGKTWLTKKMLAKERLYYKIINLATASSYNSIYKCFENIMSREKWQIKTNYSEKKSASVSVPTVATGLLETTNTYQSSIDYFMEFLKFMSYRDLNKKSKKYIVFENMESILDNEKLIKELTNLITLIDDEEVSKYRIKFILIGATKDIHQYFNKINNVNTIDNRLYELPEVSVLTTGQAKELIKRGFKKLELPFPTSELEENCIKEYLKITAGIPQRIHELCLLFAQNVRKSDRDIKQEDIKKYKEQWIKTSLNKNYTYISKLLEKVEGEDSLKSKVLFCIALRDTLYFSSSSINCEIANEFPQYASDNEFNTKTILDELCICNPPLLSKSDNIFEEYAFVDFKCALCLRAILSVENEVVIKNDIYDIL